MSSTSNQNSFLALSILITLHHLIISITCNEEFHTLAISPRYIDKTHLLSTFFRNTDTPYNYLTCPRLFGKSAILNMIETFAQVQVDRHGRPINWAETKAFEVFKNSKIHRFAGHILSQHMARYPVILLDLHFDTIEGMYEPDIVAHLNEQIQTCFKFTVMNEVNEDGAEGNSTFKPWNFTMNLQDVAFMRQVIQGRLSLPEIRNSLYRLSKILYNCFHHTKVIVLVDNYDSAAVKAMLTRHKQIGVNIFYDLVNTMLSQASTTGAEFIKYMLITGTSALPYYRDQWKLENITHRPFLDDHPFSEFCGFSQQDVEQLFDKFECDDSEKSSIKEFYNGYSTAFAQQAVYNPYSIRRYFQPEDRTLRSFWKIKPRIETIVKFMPFRTFLENLFIPVITSNKMPTNFTLLKTYETQSFGRMFEMLDLLKDIQDTHERLTRDRRVYDPIIHTFAFEQGYFTHSSNSSYAVPNQEVKQELVEKSLEYFSRKVYML
ncbi:uncharacterized protein LOC135834437 isoform X2 [Planococcus citri]|uniref:uncharacterized protein LOC135834437 isoform X2 n=1 Tax=Planococcus citri TaxID=170843 RepID=UPI0031F95128